MTWTVIWSVRARKDMRRLGHPRAQQVGRGVQRFAETDQGDVKRLQGRQPPAWRLRVGGYRVIFEYDHDAHTLLVRQVSPRGGAYQD